MLLQTAHALFARSDWRSDLVAMSALSVRTSHFSALTHEPVIALPRVRGGRPMFSPLGSPFPGLTLGVVLNA